MVVKKEGKYKNKPIDHKKYRAHINFGGETQQEDLDIKEPENTKKRVGRPPAKVQRSKKTFSIEERHHIDLKEAAFLIHRDYGVSVDFSTLVRAALNYALPMVKQRDSGFVKEVIKVHDER